MGRNPFQRFIGIDIRNLMITQSDGDHKFLKYLKSDEHPKKHLFEYRGAIFKKVNEKTIAIDGRLFNPNKKL